MFSSLVSTRWLADGRNMELLHDVSFKDSKGKVWTAYQGLVIDGASIPRLAWWFTGSPYSGKYRRASVIHDQYYSYREDPYGAPESREAVDQMFYEAMIADGVPKWKAKLMYQAVRVGGPRF